MRTAAALSRGSLLLPQLGDCTHEGQPASQGHSLTASSVRRHSSPIASNPLRAKPTPPG